MGEAETGSVLKKTLKSLCCSDGWSYGVFWRLVQRDSLLLTFEDAYYQEQAGALVDMLPQVHMMGEGVIGQAAFTGKHRWMFADVLGEDWYSISSFESQDIFQDDSEFHYEFSSGIKTIAVISVAPQGVVQFGSTQKKLERPEFLNQTKRLFQELENFEGSIPLEKAFSYLSNDAYVLNGLFDSSISSGNSRNGDLNAICYDSHKEVQGETYSATILNECSHTMLEIHDVRMAPLLGGDWDHPDNRLLTDGTETQILLSDKLTTQLQQVFSQSTWPISTGSTEDFMLTSSDPLLASQSRVQDSSNPFTSKAGRLDSCRNTAISVQGNDFSQHFCPSTTKNDGKLPETTTSMHKFSEFKLDDFTMEVSELCLVDDLSQWFSPSPEHGLNRIATALGNDHSQPIEVTSASSFLDGDDVFNHFTSKNPGNSVQSSITNTFNSDGKENSAIMHGAKTGLFENMGLDFGYDQSGEDLIMPVMSAAKDTCLSECISELDVSSMAGSRKRLFSELGLQELLDGISNSKSSAKSSFEENTSSTKRCRVDSSSVNNNQLQLTSFACSNGSMNTMQPGYNLKEKNNVPKKVLPKSQVGLWIDDSYSVNAGNTGLARPQKPEEATKANRKRARPGESTRPRPKDRQQIQDRIKELRGIIPHGGKCSIDSLLDRTIKYMLFLQGMTKYADRLKQSDEPKLIELENGVVLKDNSMGGGSGGSTWAFEVGSQTMVCPIVVEDHPPGQMLIEMLCEEQGYFLEIADIIRGFQLNILKGLMESRDDKIWARFIVEASSHVTRIDIFLSLVQLLKQTTSSSKDTVYESNKAIDGVGISLLDSSNQQQNLLHPISFAETLGC